MLDRTAIALGLVALAVLLYSTTPTCRVPLGHRATRAEAPANVNGIKSAMLAYEALNGHLLACRSRAEAEAWLAEGGPRGVHRTLFRLRDQLGGTPLLPARSWAPDACFEALGWSPDGQVRGAYWTELHDGDLTVHALIDVDADGVAAEYVATRTRDTTMLTANSIF